MFDALASRLIGVQMPSGDSNMSKKPKKRTNKKKRGPEIQQKGSFDVASLSNSSRDGIEDPDDTIDDHSEDLFELGNDTSGDVVRSASPKQKGPDPGIAAQLYHFESTQLEDQHQAMIQNLSVESGLSESIVSTTVTRMFETGRRYDDPKSVLKELNRIKAQLLSGEDDDDPTSPAASPARPSKYLHQQGTNPPQRQQHHQQMPARLTEKSGWPPVAAAAAGEEEFASAPGSPRSASPSYDAGTIETKSSPTVSSLPGTEDSGYNRHTTTNGEVDHLSKHAKHALEQLAPRRDATVTGAREGGGRGGGGGDGTRHLTTSRGSKHGIEIESAPSPRTPSSSSGSSSNFPNNANNTQHNQPHQQEQQQPMPQSVSEKLEFVAAYSTTNLYDSLSALCSWACITTSTSTISNGNAVRLERMEKLEQFFNSRALQILFTTLFSDESQPLATKPEVKSALIALLQHLLLFDPTPATAISGTASVHPTASGTSSDYEADEVGATTVVANHLTDALEQLVHQICAIRGTQVVPALLQAPGEGVGGEGMHRSLGSDIMAEKVANCVKTLYFQLYHSMLHIYRARTSGHDTVDSSDGVGGETALSKASDEELFESRLEAIDAQLRELQQGNSSSGSNETTKGKNSTTTVTSVEVAEEGAIAQKLFLSREVCTEKFQLCLENVLKLKNRVEEEQQQQQQSASNNEANGRTSTSSNGGVGSTSSVGRDKRQAELQSDAERTALQTKRKSQLLSFIRDDVEQLEQSLLQACNINPAQPLMAKHKESSSISSSYDRLQWERDSKLGGLDSELNTCQARLEQLKQQKQLLLQQLQACDEEIVSLESRSKILRDDLGFNTTFYTNKLEELQSSNVNVRKSLQTHNSVNALMDSVRSFETKVAETLLDACASQELAAERRQNLQQQQQQDEVVAVAVAGKQPSGDTSGSGSSTGAKTQKQHDVKMVITASAGGAMHITSVQGNDNTAASSNAASASHPSTSESLVQPQVQDKKGKKGKKEGKSTSSPTAADTTATPDTVVVHKFGDLTLDDLLQRRVHMLQDTVQTYFITETRCIELLCARIHQASEKLTAAKKELLAYAALQMTGSVTTVTEGKIAQLEREILEDQQAVVQLQRGVVHSLHQVNTALNTAPSSSAVSASASASSNSNSATASRTGHGRNPKSKPSAATPPAAVIPPITPPLYEIARIAASCAEAGLVAIPDIVDLAKKYSGPTEVVVRVKSTTATTGTTADAVGNATRAPPAKSTSTSGTSSSTSGHKDNQGSSNTTTTTTTNNTSAGTKRKEQKATATSRVGANTKTASAATTNATTATEKNKKNHGSSTVDPIALLEKSTVQKRGAGDQKVAAVAKANTANPAGGGSGKGGAAAKKTETSSSSSSVGATASTSNVWAAKAAATAKPPTPGLLGQDGGHKSLKEIQEEQEEEARKAAEEKKKKKNTIVVPLSEIDNNGESSSSKGTTSKHSEKPKGENSNTNSASVSDSAAGTGSASTMAHTSEPVGDIAIPEVQASPLPKRTRKKKTDPAAAGNEGENEEKATAAGEEKTSTPSSPLVLHHRTHPDKSVHGIPATGSARSSPVGAGGGGGGSGDLGDGKTGTANTPTANDTTEHGGGDGSGGSAGSGAGKEDDSMLLELSMGEESVMTAMSEIRDINPMKKAAPKSDNINTHNSSNSSNSNNNDATATATATTTAEVVAAKEGKEEGGDDDED